MNERGLEFRREGEFEACVSSFLAFQWGVCYIHVKMWLRVVKWLNKKFCSMTNQSFNISADS